MMKYLSDSDWWKQFSTNLGGVLTALMGALAILNIHYKWLTANSINAYVTVVMAVGTLFVGSFATIVNTYLTKRAKEKATVVAVDYAQEQATSEDAEREKIKAVVVQVLAAQNAGIASTEEETKSTATTK